MPLVLGRLLLIMLMGASTLAGAQQPYPGKPVQIVVPYVAGSSLDVLIRIVGQKFEERLHQPVIVLNKPGAGGMVGADYVAHAEPDGYTLLSSTNSLAIGASAYTKVNFNATRDLVPVSQLTSSPHVLVVPADLPAGNIAQLIALAKANPGKMNFAGGLGNSDQLAGELFKSTADIDIVHIPYGGAPPALAAVMGGSVQIFFSGIPAALPLIGAGKVKALGVTSNHRIPQLPQVPPIADTLPGFNVDLWYAIFAPAGTPNPIVEKLAGEFRAILSGPDVRERVLKMGLEPVGSNPAAFKTFFVSDTAKWAAIVKATKLRLD